MHDGMVLTIEDPDSLGRVLVVVHTQRGESVRRNTMREDYDFSKGKRGAVIATPGKKRITIDLDVDVIDSFQKQAKQNGVGYQTLINAALREASSKGPVTLDALRRILREELHAA